MPNLDLRLEFKKETGNYPFHDDDGFKGCFSGDWQTLDATDVSYEETEQVFQYVHWLEERILKN